MASIKRRDDGKWRARYRDESGREHARHFDRKTDAQRWLDEQTASIVSGAWVAPHAGDVTFDEWFDQWATRQVWATGTERAADLVRRSVTFARVPLGALRTSHLELWVKSQTAAGLAPGTVVTRMNTVRACLKGAVRDRLIARDPSEGVRLPRRRKSEHAMTIPTPEQVGALLAAAEPARRSLIALAAFGGLRLGEACGAQGNDIDFLRRTFHVARQVQRRDGGGLDVTPPKYGSERIVHLPDGVLALLSQHVAVGEPAWLVESTSGDALAPTTVNSWWSRVQQRAGLTGIRFHDLRHFYASGLIAAGCDVVTVQRALGHANATTTLNTYSHLWPSAEDRTRAAAAAMFQTATQNPADYLRTSGTR